MEPHLTGETKTNLFFSETIQKEVESYKIQNILDMALSFSSMTRVFNEGSNEKIINQLDASIKKLSSIDSEEEYRKIHADFCEWFMENIQTAEKMKKNGGIIKKSQSASWGQGAKVFDVSLKVYFYYCRLPTLDVSDKISPLLNGAIDTKILQYLKKRDAFLKLFKISTLGEIDRTTYVNCKK